MHITVTRLYGGGSPPLLFLRTSRMLTYADVCRHILTRSRQLSPSFARQRLVCSRMLTYAHVCSRMQAALPFLRKARHRLAYFLLYYCFNTALLLLLYYCFTYHQAALLALRSSSTRMLTYAHVCWQMLTYADVCWRMQAALLSLHSSTTHTRLSWAA